MQSDSDKNETLIWHFFLSIYRRLSFELLNPPLPANLQYHWILIREHLMRVCAHGGLDSLTSSVWASVPWCSRSPTVPSNESSSLWGMLEKGALGGVVWSTRRDNKTGHHQRWWQGGGGRSEGYISKAAYLKFVYVCDYQKHLLTQGSLNAQCCGANTEHCCDITAIIGVPDSYIITNNYYTELIVPCCLE